MKILYTLLLAGTLFACAGKAPVATNATGRCSLTDSSGCKTKSTQATQKRRAPGEVISFYEGMPEDALNENLKRSDKLETIIGAEVEDEIARTDADAVPTFDIPIVINHKVQKWMNYFTGRGRKFFAAWLSRSGRYIPMMQSILRENGLPEDLIYLAMIESGFKPYAYSRARASGPWQFIKQTGARYGLKSNYWIDERRDPEKSTIAAAQHLKDLYDQFDHWYLAAAGYNAGQGKVSRAIKRYNTEDFWKMSRYGYLRSETKNYVPKIIAAALIAKNPDRYGFTNIKYMEPLVYDKVLCPEPTELRVVAKSLKVNYKDLKELNPELKRNITPPNFPNYELKVPKGYAERFASAYPKMRKESISSVGRHTVRRGDTLSDIARQHGVPYHSLVSFNQLRSTRIYPGQKLVIPHRGKVGKRTARKPKIAKINKNAKTYKVRSGDTLWSISRHFDVSVSELRSWNNLRGSRLHPGQKLKLIPRSDPSMMVRSSSTKGMYRVQRGDNLSDIAKQFGVSIRDLKRWNKLDTSRIYPGNELKVSSPSKRNAGVRPSNSSNGDWKVYRVQKGDTLWDIAKEKNVKVSDLRTWNQLGRKGSKLMPGDKLRYRAVKL